MARVISDETWLELQEYRATQLKPFEIRRITDGIEDVPLPMDLWNIGGCHELN